MIIFLILGALLGILSLMFVFQNITPVTVTFMTWQMEGSLAVMLFLAMLSGVAITLLLLLPSLVRDQFRTLRLKQKARSLEGELAQHKAAAAPPAPPLPPDVSA